MVSKREAEKFAQARQEKEAEQAPPAEITKDGNRFWKNSAGKSHRGGDKPAVEYANGDKEWWFEGKRHHNGGKPAVERSNGTRKWYQRSNLHRDGDLPTWEREDGSGMVVKWETSP